MAWKTYQYGENYYSPEGKKRLKAWGKEEGNIKIKAVKCGKINCRKCPHTYYAYHRKLFKKEKYLYRYHKWI